MATANDITGMYGVRGELNARGIDNNRIGWNQNTGYVTVDGQNFLKPQSNVKGTTYADPTSFDQAYNVWGTQNKLNTAQQNLEQQMAQPVVNPYDQQVNDTMAQFYQRIMNPTPYDPYGTPEYAAYQAQAQRGAHQATRAAQESMGAANFGRSTNLADRAQGIQNDANEYLELQVIPQLRAANAQQQQQMIANLGSYLGALTGQQGVFDTRTQQGLQNTINYVEMLSGQRGQYVDEQYRTGRDAVGDRQWQQTFDRGVLESDRNYDRGVFEGDRNYDRGVYESDRNFDEGVRQYDLNSARQEQQWQAQFDEDRRQFGLNYALQQDANRRAAASSSRAAENDRISNLYRVWEATGVAPAGIPGVTQGTPMGGSKTAGMTTEDRASEASAMLSALRSGQMTPNAALAQIADDERVGVYSKDDASYLRSLISNAAPSAPSKQTATPEAQRQNQQAMPSNKEIEAEATKLGYPTLDYRAWYKDSNGKAAGTDFETWRTLYGPRITAR